jgi:hypothetical protein
VLLVLFLRRTHPLVSDAARRSSFIARPSNVRQSWAKKNSVLVSGPDEERRLERFYEVAAGPRNLAWALTLNSSRSHSYFRCVTHFAW